MFAVCLDARKLLITGKLASSACLIGKLFCWNLEAKRVKEQVVFVDMTSCSRASGLYLRPAALVLLSRRTKRMPVTGCQSLRGHTADTPEQQP